MQDLLRLLQDYPLLGKVAERLCRGEECFVEGLWGTSAAYLVAALAERSERTFLCVLPQIEQAEEFAEDVALFSPGPPLAFPQRETISAEDLPDAEILSQRIAVLKDLSLRREVGNAVSKHRVIVAPVQAVLQKVPSPAMMAQNALILQKGARRSPEEIASWLVERDFQQVRRAEIPGEFSMRGGILDVFPYVADAPVRIEFFGDEVESLRSFNPETQASLRQEAEVTITALPRRGAGTPSSLPNGQAAWVRNSDGSRPSAKGEGRKERGENEHGAGLPPSPFSPLPSVGERHCLNCRDWVTLFDHLPADSLIVLKEPAEVMSRAEDLSEQELDDEIPAKTGHSRGRSDSHSSFSLHQAVSRFQKLHLAGLPGVFSGRPVTFHVHSVERFAGELDMTLKELELVTAERDRTIVFCNNAGERQRLIELLADSSLLQEDRFQIRLGRLNHGFDWADLSLALLAHHEIFHRYRQRRVAPRFRHTRAIDSFYELQAGDLVVHATHGIGRYRGMEMLDREGEKDECLRIEYADKSFLYVPASRIELVQKYVGPSEHRPQLSRLGTKGWAKRKERAEHAVRDLAADLLRMQAVRAAMQGIAHPPDSDWQREFENAFPYEETEDQLRVAEEVKRDMELPKPTDRLICGDVGYGKTEIAMRAAFKTVVGGRQVAMLVPTTILAVQHTRTFRERMADYPVVIEMLSRFVTRASQERVLSRLADGQVDIVIGTHRLVQPDVGFKNLGLLVIDEEQRFGVAHKERLKRLRETVDVLTLTATPIPRTLHMSLLGIRDISSLDTPIRDRLAITTRLQRFDPHKIRQAILHEMARDGQVFFVHNRVETIHGVAERLRELMPDAVIVVGHGQMPERELAGVMRDFVEHKADVLVCTTIIESGLDIPNVNTIIIHQADIFGLADLHQLRGRVGRYKHRAYAYLLLPTDRPVTPVAEKRLKAIEEFAELGAGFRIAMRDLEIRGAGNILGPQQSGHLAAVGYDMYCQLLERAVRELKNEPAVERIEVSTSIGLDAFLPEHYVPDPSQRIDLYRKLHRAQDPSDLGALREEFQDRFGPLPAEAENLLAEARLRQLAQQARIVSITTQYPGADRRTAPSAFVRPTRSWVVIQAADTARTLAALAATDQVVRLIDDHTLHLRIRTDRANKKAEHISGEFLVSFLTRVLERGLNKQPDESRKLKRKLRTER